MKHDPDVHQEYYKQILDQKNMNFFIRSLVTLRLLEDVRSYPDYNDFAVS